MSVDDAVRARSFGAAAEQYDKARPSYPAELVDDLLALSPRTVLEVGCGTGKASELFTARGVELVAVEPDERMAAVARRKGIDVEISPFESWDPRGRTFDLIIAGQSWHWVAQPQGSQLAHAVLRPGGHIATFWNIGSHDEAVLRVLDPVYAEVAPSIAATTTALRFDAAERSNPSDRQRLTDAGFAAAELRTYPWTATYSTSQWVAYIATHSDHMTLPSEQLAVLLEGVRDAVDHMGGSLTYNFVTALILAERP
jgi:SAM-dependent methyltransferase